MGDGGRHERKCRQMAVRFSKFPSCPFKCSETQLIDSPLRKPCRFISPPDSPAASIETSAQLKQPPYFFFLFVG